MQTLSNLHVRRKKIFVGNIGFKRRMIWARPFSVAIFRVEYAGAAVAA